jgi:hypothetical protein
MLTYETRGKTQFITRREDGIRGMDHPSTLAISVMRNSARIKHVAPSLVVRESKSYVKYCAES